MEAEIILRKYDSKTDDPYIYSTWSKFCYYSLPQSGALSPKDKKEWFKQKSAQIRQYLEAAQTLVACLRDDPDFLVGYVVGDSQGILWLCVKKQFRNQGIEQLLINGINPKEFA